MRQALADRIDYDIGELAEGVVSAANGRSELESHGRLGGPYSRPFVSLDDVFGNTESAQPRPLSEPRRARTNAAPSRQAGGQTLIPPSAPESVGYGVAGRAAP